MKEEEEKERRRRRKKKRKEFSDHWQPLTDPRQFNDWHFPMFFLISC